MPDIATDEFLNRRAKAWVEREPVYKFLCDAYEGGQRFTDNHLFRFSPRETQRDYDRRKQQAVYPNLVRRTLGIYRDHVFEQGDSLRRDIEHPDWLVFQDDQDRNGTSANVFWGHVGIRALLYGWMGVLVDMPRRPELGRDMTRADLRMTGMAPYYVPVCPMEIVDWSLDEFGALNWVHLVEMMVDDAKPFTKREERTTHRVYGRNEWWVYDDKGSLLDTGQHGLGAVPFVVVRIDQSEHYPLIGTSFMEDYARLNRLLANSLSLRHDFLSKNALQILTVQLQPMVAAETGDEDMVIRNLLEYSGERAPQFIGPNTGGAEFMFRHVEDLLAWMRMLASLQDIDVTTMAPQSGIAKLVDFEQTNAALTAFADALEAAETAACRLWFRWQGIEWQDKWVIDYPDAFNVRSLIDEVAQVHQVRATYGDLAPTVVAEVARVTARRLIDDPTPELMAAIEAELDENAHNLAQEAVVGGRIVREAAREEPEEEIEV